MLSDFSFILDHNIHMTFSFTITVIAIYMFARERTPLEVTSVMVLTALLLFGQLFPLHNSVGQNLLGAEPLLKGFANPALIAVLALLVIGQALVHTDALRALTNIFVTENKALAWLSLLAILLLVMVLSAFMNNTPLVIIAIPLIQALAKSAGLPESRIMMPLSFVAIMGGMTTLIGSSTNLLVNDSMRTLGYEPLEFFDFVAPGVMLAVVGFVYVLFVAPFLLRSRGTLAQVLKDDTKEFVAEIDVNEDSELLGMTFKDGKFEKLGDLNIKLIQRSGQIILPPFEGYEAQSGDVIIVAATRETLTEMLSKYPGFLLSEEESEAIKRKNEEHSGVPGVTESRSAETRVLAEIMITPASRMVDMSLEQVSFHRQFGAMVLGIQRRARVVRRRLGRIRLEAGDVLLVGAKYNVIDSMRSSSDFIVLSGSRRDLPVLHKAPIATLIFLAVIGTAATGLMSIPVAAMAGAVAMIATGCLNIRQATRAIDRKIFILVGSMLALGTALEATGGTGYVANGIMGLPFVDSPLAMVSTLFLIVAISTNVLSNNACAILFTPIAMSLASSTAALVDPSIDLVYVYAVTVIFGANCSFASPIGYQTNLLVMGPGHYRFRDFLKAGLPLVILMWLAYTVIAKYYFGL